MRLETWLFDSRTAAIDAVHAPQDGKRDSCSKSERFQSARLKPEPRTVSVLAKLLKRNEFRLILHSEREIENQMRPLVCGLWST